MEKPLTELRNRALEKIITLANEKQVNEYWLIIFGKSGEFTLLAKELAKLSADQKPAMGKLANTIKKEIEMAFQNQKNKILNFHLQQSFDPTIPGIMPPHGHLHLVTQAIEEIVKIFEKIGFTLRVYPEVEWDWYSYGSLNFPVDHPARDDIETFFIDAPPSEKYGRMLLSPHTSSGQVREMISMKIPPIRMINIAKCYRPNWDISHTPMFHQFEGLVIDRDINITHLKGTMDYFARNFFGPTRKTRLRPFHFQFTEPSFEVDITCDICQGKGKLDDGSNCRMCKEGWLELGGSGMVHPKVLENGGIDHSIYSGFAFGWGVERTYMMKSGLKLPDIRILYENDVRFLEQF